MRDIEVINDANGAPEVHLHGAAAEAAKQAGVKTVNVSISHGDLQAVAVAVICKNYISFAQRMREKAEAEGADLLLIDTGDRIDGNGLYDASDPKGQYLYELFKQQHIDLICSGNHELYKQNSSESELNITVPE
ncbi:hypothetical protein VTN31DRAFT_621 [Thermomyces dupontii]|uniref:uncharacterized protein n=1 Tax=Talaromyces thermophilus TaxID=28565 RepID=UPI003744440F